MKFRVPLFILLGAIIGTSVAYAAILQTIQIGGTANVLVTGGDDISYKIYIDESLTQELTGSIDFGDVYRGGNSDPKHIWIQNTGTTTWSLNNFRDDASSFGSVSTGVSGSTTLGPNDVLNIWFVLYVDHDASAGPRSFNIFIDIVG